MNRNVEALNAAWMEYVRAGAKGNLGEFLADLGVLAVDSLTDEQAEIIWGAAAEYPGTSWNGADFAGAEPMRAALRRCATGEGKT